MFNTETLVYNFVTYYGVARLITRRGFGLDTGFITKTTIALVTSRIPLTELYYSDVSPELPHFEDSLNLAAH
jgi:hypothetical protein